jgi:peroxiredoxin
LHGLVSQQADTKVTILAISPETTERSLSLVEKHQLSFSLLSDETGQVMKDYDLMWEIPTSIREQYIALFERDLNVINTGAGWVLPVPATYILNREGVIVERYINEDYTARMEPSEVLEVLTKL